MNKEQLIVVDPVLCYVSNHRGLVPDQDLRTVVVRYFADSRIVDAYEILNRRTSSLLAEKDESENATTTASVESILRIFKLCDRYRIELPEFAVTDLNGLPPPPSSSSIRADFDYSIVDTPSISNSGRGVVTEKSITSTNNDALFTRRMLLKIVKELKQLKSLVAELSINKKTVNVGVNAILGDGDEDGDEDGSANKEDEEIRDFRVTEHSAVVNMSNSPQGNGQESVDEQQSPSRTSSASISRPTALTPPRKRGSTSRSLSSIEDAVAKIKAQRCTVSSTYYNCPNSNNDSLVDNETCSSKTPSPKIDDSINNKSPILTPVYCDTTPNTINNDCDIFPSQATARNLMGSMIDPSLFLPRRMDLVNSAAASFMAASGVFPVSSAANAVVAALSPLGAFSASTPSPQQHQQMIDSCFAAPASTNSNVIGNLLIRQQKIAMAIRSGHHHSAMMKQQQMAIKVKKAKTKQRESTPTPTTIKDETEAGNETQSQQQEKDDGCSLSEAGDGESGNGGKKPYECTYANCHKRFANKFLLKKHEFIHTGLRPYQCPYCLKKFNRKDNLLRHKVTHEKNYTKPRRRSCRVFGVKRSALAVGIIGTGGGGHQSDLSIASAGVSPTGLSSADSSKTFVQQRSASCAPNSNEIETTNRQTTPVSLTSSAPLSSQESSSTIFQHSANNNLPTPAEFSLATLASYTALAQSLWPRAAMSGVHSLNN